MKMKSLKSCMVNLSILVTLMVASPSGVDGADRVYPWCVTKWILEDYRGDNFFEEYVQDHMQQKFKSMNTFIGNTGSFIEDFEMFRIRHVPTPWPGLRLMRQWIHILVRARVTLKGLMVQAISAPLGLPDGVFDLEFACRDCGDGLDPYKANHEPDKNALPGIVVPCSRRAHINARHPTVYTSNGVRRKYHMNFSFVDIMCRPIQMLQFMILAITEDGQHEMIYTPIIDHDFVDAPAGNPWPFTHTTPWELLCHVPDSRLYDTEKLNLFPIPGGHKFRLFVSKVYDDCVNRNGQVDDWSPDWLCADPARSFCDSSEPSYHPSRITVESKKQPWYPAGLGFNDAESRSGDPGSGGQGSEVTGSPWGQGGAIMCPTCPYHGSTEASKEAYRRFVHRGYLARRFHGVAMILGCIAILVVSIHVARYLKETGGGVSLVGWWMWVHLGLTLFGTASIWMGYATVVAMRPRYTSTHDNPHIGNKRAALMKIHTIIGYATLVTYHLVLINGYSRPMRTYWRLFMMWIHAFGGHLEVLLAVAAVLLSTACRETIFWTVVIFAFSVIISAVAMVIQLLFTDNICGCKFKCLQNFKCKSCRRQAPHKIRRSYFPVIEAIRVHRHIPCKWVHLAILLVLFLGTTACYYLIVVKGSYHGLYFSPCENCRWKYDELLVREQTPTETLSWYFHVAFECKYDKRLWEDLIEFDVLKNLTFNI